MMREQYNEKSMNNNWKEVKDVKYDGRYPDSKGERVRGGDSWFDRSIKAIVYELGSYI